MHKQLSGNNYFVGMYVCKEINSMKSVDKKLFWVMNLRRQAALEKSQVARYETQALALQQAATNQAVILVI